MSTSPQQISCILTAYNAQRYIRETLESILSQKHVSIELIVVDDGSTDDTAAITQTYGGHLRLVRQRNLGQSAARNTGVELSRFPLVTFMDADDLYPTDRFRTQLRAFDEDAELEVCAGHVQNFEGDLKFIGPPVAGYNTDVLVRRSVFDKVGMLRPELRHASRLEWMLRVRAAKVRELLVPDTLIYRRLHGENMSTVESGNSLREHLLTLHASLKTRR